MVWFTSNVIQPSDTATAMINALLSLRYISSFAVIRLAYRKWISKFCWDY